MGVILVIVGMCTKSKFRFSNNPTGSENFLLEMSVHISRVIGLLLLISYSYYCYLLHGFVTKMIVQVVSGVACR